MTKHEMAIQSILTANRLHDGVVVWMAADHGWSPDRRAAAAFSGQSLSVAQAAAADDVADQRIVGLYEIRLDGVQDLSAREAIRAAGGPSITPPVDRQEDQSHV